MKKRIPPGSERKFLSISSKFVILAATTLFLDLTPHGAFAQQLSDALRVARQGLHFNGRALGMGNAYSTIGGDFSALRFNPATLALSKKASYTASWNTNAFQSSSDYYGTHTDFTVTSTPAGQIGLTFPFHLDTTHSVIIGLGYTQPKDFDLGYKYEGVNCGSPSFIQGMAARAGPTGAW